MMGVVPGPRPGNGMLSMRGWGGGGGGGGGESTLLW